MLKNSMTCYIIFFPLLLGQLASTSSKIDDQKNSINVKIKLIEALQDLFQDIVIFS